MPKKEGFSGKKLLLMGSKAFKEKELPREVKEKIDEAVNRHMTIIVGEAPGSCRLYQDYLHSKRYSDVIVGHAKSMRYNAGSWKTVRYGDDVTEREGTMIQEADSALIIWADKSGVIAENLELLKRRGVPTFIYEYENKTGSAKSSWLDPERMYDPYYYAKQYWKKKRRQEEQKDTTKK